MTENASDAVERAAVGDPSKMDMLPGGINIVGVLANEAGVLIVHTLRHDHQIQILIVRIERWKRPIGDPRFQKVADIAVGEVVRRIGSAVYSGTQQVSTAILPDWRGTGMLGTERKVSSASWT